MPNDLFKIADSLARNIFNASKESEDMGTGLENEKLVIAGYSIMSIPQLLEINKICLKILDARRKNYPIPKRINAKLSNPKDYIKAFSNPKLSVEKLEKIQYIIGRVIQRKQEQKRVKLDVGNIDKQIKKDNPL
jgi:hypothetical protein